MRGLSVAGNDLKIKPVDYTAKTLVIQGSRQEDENASVEELRKVMEDFNKYSSKEFNHITWKGKEGPNSEEAWDESRNNKISLSANLPHDPSQPISYNVSKFLLANQLSEQLVGGGMRYSTF